MKEKKELTDKDKQAVEIISKAIAILGGAGFIYWVLTSMEII
tara:strand:+ start:1434 stop:1559 length:126 start_codon:yes stop_codon:yes gene_type:complete